jgi:hypothetical protein
MNGLSYRRRLSWHVSRHASLVTIVTTTARTPSVSREEQPITIEPPKSAPRSLPLRVGVPAAPVPTNAALAAAPDPREPPPTVAVASPRVGQPVAADVTAAASKWVPSPLDLPQ